MPHLCFAIQTARNGYEPAGATALGDLLILAKTDGGFGMGASWASALFLTVIVVLVATAQLNVNRLRNAQTTESPVPPLSRKRSCAILILQSPAPPPWRRP